jgi:acyl-CoA synthetase (AMP-forming)/AMP-acid ligase II
VSRHAVAPRTASAIWTTTPRTPLSTPTTGGCSPATSDFIIRGGKNVSAAVVEDEVSSHPAVAMAAAVAAPDDVFGERVCVYVELRPGEAAPTLDELRDHLARRGVGKESWPEHLVVTDALPRSSGGKIAKGELRADVRRRLAGRDRPAGSSA